MYSIVEFTADEPKSTNIVPDQWLNSDATLCRWPNNPRSSDIRNCISPEDGWGLHPCRLLGKAETYKIALRKQSRSTYTSELSTEDFGKTYKIALRKQSRSTYTSELSTEDDEQAKKKRKVRARVIRSDTDTDEEADPDDAPEPPQSFQMRKSLFGVSCAAQGSDQPSLHVETPTRPVNGTLQERTPVASAPRSGTSTPCAAQGSDLPALHVETPTRPVNRTLQKRTPVASAPGTGTAAPCTSQGTDQPSLHVETPTRPVNGTLQKRTPVASGGSQQALMTKVLDALHTVMETQRELKETQRIQGAVLNRIHRMLRGGSSGGDLAADLPQGAQLPLESVEGLRLMDERLATDEDHKKAMIQYLGSKGGSTVDECVKRVMPELVTTAFGRQCNISGAARHGKYGIGKTMLFRIIFHAVKLNPTVACTEKDLEKSVAKWLTNCRDRDGLRNERGRVVRQPEPEPAA